VGETSEQVQAALEAYLEFLEIGGPQPDTSHLSRSEQRDFEELIDALDLTEGVALGLGRDVVEIGAPAVTATAAPELTERLLSQLRDIAPPDVRVEPDTSRFVPSIGGVEIAAGWIVGTFGGRLRVWLLAVETAQELEGNRDCLADLNRVYGAFPDTAAIALVAEDLSCLLVQPEDCAPQITIPSGSLIGRRFSKPVRPATEAISEFLDELIPYWDPIPAFDQDTGLSIDTSAVGKEFVATAIENQRGIGRRARKGNPKKDALLAMGEREVSALTKLTNGLLDGAVQPEEIENTIERLATEE
jgi:hypothetical protein